MGDEVSHFSSPTPIHAPRPRPIAYSVGIGTSDFAATTSNTWTQGGPPPLDLSSFLQDLSLAGVSSPIARAPVSVLSPTFHRYLKTGPPVRSPTLVRVTFCRGTSTRGDVEYVDVAINAVCAREDREVLAVMGCCDAAKTYDPPVEAVPVVPLPVVEESESAATDFASPGLRSPVSPGSTVDLPEDFTVDGLLAVRSIAEATVSTSDADLGPTSPMGPSLISSDDEPIALHLPGYLSGFYNLCEVPV